MRLSEAGMMRLKGILRSVLLAFVVFSLGWWAHVEVSSRSAGKTAGPSATNAANEVGRKVVAYYFHGNVRCQSCIDIERFSDEAIKEGFPGELYGGLLEYRVVNVQKPENKHYMDDYKLSWWALVLVEYRNGQQTRWKNLEKVWEYVLGDPGHFHDYVKKEVRNFLAEEG